MTDRAGLKQVDDFLRRLSHVDSDILIWIRGLLVERDARPDRIASALADCPDTADWTLRERDRLAVDLHAALARLSRLPSETGDE